MTCCKHLIYLYIFALVLWLLYDCLLNFSPWFHPGSHFEMKWMKRWQNSATRPRNTRRRNNERKRVKSQKIFFIHFRLEHKIITVRVMLMIIWLFMVSYSLPYNLSHDYKSHSGYFNLNIKGYHYDYYSIIQ